MNSTTINSTIRNSGYDAKPGSSAEQIPGKISRQRKKGWKYLVLCYTINQERRRLSKMTDSQLDDIGVDKTDARSEAARRFFDIPDNRR